jgi:hypothetical protein
MSAVCVTGPEGRGWLALWGQFDDLADVVIALTDDGVTADIFVAEVLVATWAFDAQQIADAAMVTCADHPSVGGEL